METVFVVVIDEQWNDGMSTCNDFLSVHKTEKSARRYIKDYTAKFPGNTLEVFEEMLHNV